MSLGIPYAREFGAGGKRFALCPICDTSVELKIKKDFESYTGEEYAKHYERMHHGRDTNRQTSD